MRFIGTVIGLLVWNCGTILGLIAVVLGALRVRRSAGDERAHAGWLMFGLIASVVSAAAALLVLYGVTQDGNAIVGAIAAIQLMVSVLAIVLFRTRWRPLTEGLAAVALGIFSFLSGFSIGMLVLPVAAVLGSVAVNHNDPRMHRFSRAVSS
jgi:hypothetical protein